MSNAAMSEISARLRAASEGEGRVKVLASWDGENTIRAEFPALWLSSTADRAWVEALRTWLDHDGTAVGYSRQNVLSALEASS